MTPRTWEQALDSCLAEMRAVMIERHQKYGPGNITRRGLVGVEVRLGDKLERFTRWVDYQGNDFSDESIEDTFLDIGNYGGPIALMVRRGWWQLPAECLGQVAEPIPVIRAEPRCDWCVVGIRSFSDLFRVCGLCGGTFCESHIDHGDHECEGAKEE